MSGIYCIRNLSSGKVYVGSSHNVVQRLFHHRGRLRAGRHANSYLQRAWNNHGEDSFRFELLEGPLPISDLIVAEQGWIDDLNATDRSCGYNYGPAKHPNLGMKRPLSTRIKQSRSLRGKPKPDHIRAMVSARNIATGAGIRLGRYWKDLGFTPTQKLTAADVAAIRARKSSGESNAQLAAAYGVDKSTISRTSRGVTHAAA